MGSQNCNTLAHGIVRPVPRSRFGQGQRLVAIIFGTANLFPFGRLCVIMWKFLIYEFRHKGP